MGLDMYLYKKTYVKRWNHNGNDNYKVEVTKAGKPTNIDPMKVVYVIEEMGYWRKANQIHQWFVNNVQGGNDNCGNYWVSRDNLEELLELCNKVLSDKTNAGEYLPTASGFFFGSTDYDEDYFQDIENTIEIIQSCLSDSEANEFEYNSSW